MAGAQASILGHEVGALLRMTKQQDKNLDLWWFYLPYIVHLQTIYVNTAISCLRFHYLEFLLLSRSSQQCSSPDLISVFFMLVSYFTSSLPSLRRKCLFFSLCGQTVAAKPSCAFVDQLLWPLGLFIFIILFIFSMFFPFFTLFIFNMFFPFLKIRV